MSIEPATPDVTVENIAVDEVRPHTESHLVHEAVEPVADELESIHETTASGPAFAKSDSGAAGSEPSEEAAPDVGDPAGLEAEPSEVAGVEHADDATDLVQTADLDNSDYSTVPDDGTTANETTNSATPIPDTEPEPAMFETTFDESIKPESIDAEPFSESAAVVAAITENDFAQLGDRWRDVQGAFVDNPREAVIGADELVHSTIEGLLAGYADRRKALYDQWTASGDVDTEQLRQSIRSYRDLFQHLIR